MTSDLSRFNIRSLMPLVIALGLAFLTACANQQPSTQSASASDLRLAPAQNEADSSLPQIESEDVIDSSSMAQSSAPDIDITTQNRNDIDLDKLEPNVNNPFFHPLTPLMLLVYKGEEEDEGEIAEIRVETRILPATEEVGGVDVTVVLVEEYEDDELIDRTWEFYAQGEDGTVVYMGEAVDEIEGGKVVGHNGQWFAGDGGNLPGTFMPAYPQVGDVFAQERVPGVAEEESRVVAIGMPVTTPAGSFIGCIQTEEKDPLDEAREFKFYCPGIGLVREKFDGGFLDLVSIGTFNPYAMDEDLIESLRKSLGF